MKITDDMKIRMCEMRANHTLQEIADYFKVSVYSVYCATRLVSKPSKSRKGGRSWPDVAAVREYRKAHSLQDTADKFGVSTSWVYNRTRDIDTKNCDFRSKHPWYGKWVQIKRRCDNPSCRAYSSYGGRGIKLHGPWYDFNTFVNELFLEIGECPKDHSLDRINNDGNYEPGNLRWATAIEQRLNRRDTKKRIKFLGKDMTYDEISEITGFTKSLIKSLRLFPEIIEARYRKHVENSEKN